MELEYLLPRERNELDENTPAVLEVSDSVHKTGPLQAVEQERDSPGAKSRHFGERAGGHRAVLVEEVDATDIGGVQPEDPTECLVDTFRRDKNARSTRGSSSRLRLRSSWLMIYLSF